MEERIKAQVKDCNPAEIEELNLDNVRESKLVGLSGDFTSLKTLSAINVGLTSLDGLPALPSITKLELGDNKLAGGLETLGQNCPALRHLSLVGNRLSLVEELAPLKSLEQLDTLDLLDCPLTKQESYRNKVFELLPGLKSLDGLDQAGQEVEESDSDGEEEDGEGEGESEGEDDVGLDYLNKELDSEDDSSEGDYEPGEEEEGEEGIEDHFIVSDDEGEGEGEPAPKRQKISKDSEQTTHLETES